jgi:hypothetical protein
MSGPGRTKLPINFYIDRTEMAVINAEARETKRSKTDVVRGLIADLTKRRTRRGRPVPRPVPAYSAKWFAKKRKKAKK